MIRFQLSPLTEGDAKLLSAYYDDLGLKGITTVSYQYPAFVVFYLPDDRIADFNSADEAKKNDMIDIFLTAKKNQSDTVDFSTAYNTEYTKRYP